MPALEYPTDPLAIALGNPVHSRALRRCDEGEADLMLKGITILDCCGPPPEDDDEGINVPGRAATSFLYQADKERYETGYYITVRYSWNDDIEDCVENVALCLDGLDMDTFRNEILDKIPHLLPVTLVEITTKNAELEVVDHSQEIKNDKVYPTIPDTLAAIPRVQISSLRKCPTTTLSFFIDIVSRLEDLGPTKPWYAFKRYRIPLQKQGQPMEDLLLEAEILGRLDSPYIIKPAFIVTDDVDGPGGPVFRGYLMPFMPAGSVLFVFEELCAKTSWCTPMFLHPSHLENFVPPRRQSRALKPAAPQLPWGLKHVWAIEATSALTTLHANNIYSGDVKLHNILLDREGHLQFIDVAPQPMYTQEYVAPELNVSCNDPLRRVLPLNEARDIFAFGIVLWQIAEEEGHVTRADASKPPRLDWRSDAVQGSTPIWYRNLVDRCISSDPAERPSARDLLGILESQNS